MARNTDRQQPTYAARDVRQADTVLRSPARRVIFITGLVLLVLVAFAGSLLVFV